MGKIKQVPITSDSMRYPAAVIYAAAANQDDDFKRRVGSVILNRLDSGKREFGADTGNIMDVINRPNAFYEVQSKRYQNALNGKFENKQEEAAFKKSLAVMSGLIKGSLERADGEFWFNPSEEKKLRDSYVKSKGKAGMNFDLLELSGKSGSDEKARQFNFYKYRTQGGVSSGKNDVMKIQKALVDNGFNPGPIDGIMGKRTKTAMKQYQAKTGKPIL